jgi:hypothetical protein
MVLIVFMEEEMKNPVCVLLKRKQHTAVHPNTKEQLMFSTQESSKPRLKNDTLGEDALQRLYAMYESSLPLGQFKQVCEDTVRMGGGKQARKDEIISAIRSTESREVSLKKAQDFILAGMGLGV